MSERRIDPLNEQHDAYCRRIIDGDITPSEVASFYMSNLVNLNDLFPSEPTCLFSEWLTEMSNAYSSELHHDEFGNFSRLHINKMRKPAEKAYLAAVDEAHEYRAND